MKFLLPWTYLIGVFVTARCDIIAPRLDIPQGSSYHGLISEDSFEVKVTPKIKTIDGGSICGFRITKKHHGEAPFELVIANQETGEADLRARRPLNCEKRKSYSFDFVAVACTGAASQNATVHITVTDVNEFSPKFTAPAYIAEVDEGRLYESVIQVEAEDEDCSEKFSDICKYAILNEEEPFAIDDEGVIRTTIPLSHDDSHNYILKVVAYDCGMKMSDPVLVTIKVNRVCKLGWQDVPERISYSPGSGRKSLFPDTKFDLCNVPCTAKDIQSRISLAASHLGKKCDRDTYSVTDQRKLCGSADESIDLLPFAGPGTEWTASLQTDEGRQADPVFAFDGATGGAIIPSHVLPHNFTHVFSISVWMKHASSLTADKRIKEHIFCLADDHHMNRHHVSLFIRNCRLILLVRREFGDGDLNSFKPAEWRWKLPQVCDDEWHHYTVNVEDQDIQLYVDGVLFKSDARNPEIIDDWPLHPAPGLNTTAAVGACWQGSEQRLKHHMKGYLSGLSILIGKLESSEVISCLRRCQEGLELPSFQLLQPGMQILNNNDMTEISVNGENKSEIESIVRQIAYKNSREFPVPGRRGVRLYTSIVCESGKVIKLPPVESEVIVQPALEPVISLSGVTNLSLEYSYFEHGVRLFPDVQIIVTTEDDDYDDDSFDDDSEEDDETDDEILSSSARIDSCLVTLSPPLNPDHEIVALPEGLLQQLGLKAKMSTEGFLLKGTDKAFRYEQVLRQVTYSNRRPAYYLTRVFKLICSELNGRFISNELSLTLNVLHPTQTSPASSRTTKEIPSAKIISHRLTPIQQAKLEMAKHHVDIPQPFSDLYYSSQSGNLSRGMAQGAGHAVTIVVIVCASFLILMITLGVVRVRAAQKRAKDEANAESEMAWDDMALNITVNPLEALDSNEKATMTVVAQVPEVADDSASDSNDSSDDYDFDDDDDDDFRVDHITQSKDLEWDQSL
ncbi:calsyntenin-1-like [Artemia franciscana]|uniref:calsyntenin-1-like n=1 Tax=Artemia franciscana TaxID=6661 RepID=UPI0032DAE227